MGDVLSIALSAVGNFETLATIALATLAGVVFGIVPGLGGKLAIALFIPVVILLEPRAGLIFLVSMHAVVHTGGSIPSILLGIPGSGPDAATVIDGYPMAQQGQAGRALGASLFASACGGVIGALFLFCLLPLLEPILLLIGPSEFFLLAVLGITTIAAVSGRDLNKGIVTACFGLALTCVGLSPNSGEPRFTFGQLFLWDGVDFVTAILAIFVIPEMIAAGIAPARPDANSAGYLAYRRSDLWSGMRDVITHRWLALRTSLLGSFIGMIPGLGGDVAAWVSYGHAVQSSKHPERFGKGAVEGVIAPETANNAKEGGALLPTLFLGIPGSSGMAVLLGAFVVLGIQPGPELLATQRPLVIELVTVLVVSNVMAVVLLLMLARYLVGIARFPNVLLVPVVLALVVTGCLLSSHHWQNLLLLLVLGTIGWGLKRYGWPRPPFAIGLALGAIAENALQQSLAIWGWEFLLRTPSLILVALIVASLAAYFYRRRDTNAPGN